MRIVVVAAGTRGDVEPHLALSVALARRGHQVTLCAPLDFEATALAYGVSYRPIRVSFRGIYETPEGAALLASDSRPLEFIRVLRKIVVPVADQTIRDIGEACAGAELVCYSALAVPAFYFAKEMGVPAIATGMQPLGRTRAYPSPLFPLADRLPAQLNHLTHLLAEQLLWQMYRPLLRRRWKSGLPLMQHFSDVYRSGSPMLFGYSQALVHRPSDYLPWMHVTGFWALPPDQSWRPPAGLSEFLAGGPAPVCVGFGSMNTRRVGTIIPLVLDVLAARGQRAIVLTGWWGGTIDARVGNDVYVTESVPHAWLFPKVSTVIHHGGAGTTTAALRAAVPSVIVPFFFDQRFWGQTLRQRHLGPEPIPARHFSGAALDRALAEIEASTLLRRRLHGLSETLNGEDGVRVAVDVIEDAMEAEGEGKMVSGWIT